MLEVAIVDVAIHWEGIIWCSNSWCSNTLGRNRPAAAHLYLNSALPNPTSPRYLNCQFILPRSTFLSHKMWKIVLIANSFAFIYISFTQGVKIYPDFWWKYCHQFEICFRFVAHAIYEETQIDSALKCRLYIHSRNPNDKKRYQTMI